MTPLALSAPVSPLLPGAMVETFWLGSPFGVAQVAEVHQSPRAGEPSLVVMVGGGFFSSAQCRVVS